MDGLACDRDQNFYWERRLPRRSQGKLPDGGTLSDVCKLNAPGRKDAISRSSHRRERAIDPCCILVYRSGSISGTSHCDYTDFSPDVLEPHFIDYSKYIFNEHNRGKDMNLEKFMAS